ncbi:MAG: polymer-forming cytoskeletal protein [Verrucomicrobiota bacterium]
MFQKIITNSPESLEAPRPLNPPSAAAQTTPEPVAMTPPPSSPGASASAHRLGSDVIVKGTIRFQDELIVDGRVEGEINSDGALTIRENAHIKASLNVGSILILGKVHGNVTVAGAVELRAGSEVVGDIKAASLSMEAGAVFVGKSQIGATTAQPTKDSAPAANKNRPKVQITKTKTGVAKAENGSLAKAS